MRENAKQALERYMHYYQRWAENDKARLQVWSCVSPVPRGKQCQSLPLLAPCMSLLVSVIQFTFLA